MKDKIKYIFKYVSFAAIAIITIAALVMCTFIYTPKKTNAVTSKYAAKSQIKIHYINVGQGDSELIQQNGHNMLIDTGTNASSNTLISYLRKQGVRKLDYLILTHPHEDHIGGADIVISSFNIGMVYMPKVVTTTTTFKDVVTAMNSRGLKASQPKIGSNFKLGDANCTILGPINSNKEDLNTYSIVLKVTFGSSRFLFTGDAQASNEYDMMSKGYNLNADVLKVGHHGSHTSTSEAFLQKVHPKYAVISCGAQNDYGHPHKATMDKLKKYGIKVYRTDECGNITCISDGKNISFSCKAGSYSAGEIKKAAGKAKKSAVKSRIKAKRSVSNSSVKRTSKSKGTSSVKKTSSSRIVFWTTNGKSYHYSRNCKTLKRSKKILQGPLSKCPKKDPCNICVH